MSSKRSLGEAELPDKKSQHTEPFFFCEAVSVPTDASETISRFFERYRRSVKHKGCCVVDAISQPGLYLHKRPIIAPAGAANPLAALGTVYQHVVLYWAQEGGQVHALEFGPADGADMAANIMAAVPARRCLQRDVEPPQAGVDGALPLLYLGRPDMGLEDERLHRVLEAMEASCYHTLRHNCIHFGDAVVRLVTGGRVCGAPLLYDITGGTHPQTDDPITVFLQASMKLPPVCDGTALYVALCDVAEGKPASLPPLSTPPATAAPAATSTPTPGPAVGNAAGPSHPTAAAAAVALSASITTTPISATMPSAAAAAPPAAAAAAAKPSTVVAAAPGAAAAECGPVYAAITDLLTSTLLTSTLGGVMAQHPQHQVHSPPPGQLPTQGGQLPLLAPAPTTAAAATATAGAGGGMHQSALAQLLASALRAGAAQGAQGVGTMEVGVGAGAGGGGGGGEGSQQEGQ